MESSRRRAVLRQWPRCPRQQSTAFVRFRLPRLLQRRDPKTWTISRVRRGIHWAHQPCCNHSADCIGERDFPEANCSLCVAASRMIIFRRHQQRWMRTSCEQACCAHICTGERDFPEANCSRCVAASRKIFLRQHNQNRQPCVRHCCFVHASCLMARFRFAGLLRTHPHW